MPMIQSLTKQCKHRDIGSSLSTLSVPYQSIVCRLSPLHYAVENISLNCIDCFTQRPGVANMSDANGRNPIMWAAMKGQDKILQAGH